MSIALVLIFQMSALLDKMERLLHFYVYTRARPESFSQNDDIFLCMLRRDMLKCGCLDRYCFSMRVANGSWWIGEHDKTLSVVQTGFAAYPVLCFAHQPLLSVDMCVLKWMFESNLCWTSERVLVLHTFAHIVAHIRSCHKWTYIAHVIKALSFSALYLSVITL